MRPSANDKLPKNAVIPVEEDMRRLFQECKIGRGNAQLLGEALVFATPEDLKKEIIKVKKTFFSVILNIVNL